MRLIDLFAEMDKKHLRIQDQIRNEYFRVKEDFGRRPTRLELFTYMDIGQRTFEKDSHYAGSFPYKIGKWFFRKKRWVCDFIEG